MADYSWATGTSGDWGTSTDWTGGIPNNPSAAVTIQTPGNYIVTIAAGESFTANSVTLSNDTTTLNIAGTLALAGTDPAFIVGDSAVTISGLLDLGGSTAPLDPMYSFIALQKGTIANGTIVSGEVNFGHTATLDHITFTGNETLSGNIGVQLNIYDGLTVENSVASAPGTLDLYSTVDFLDFKDSQTLSNLVINEGSAAGTIGYSDEIVTPAYTSSNHITFANTTTIISNHGDSNIIAAKGYSTFTNDGLVQLTSDFLGIQGHDFVNNGTIDVVGGPLSDLTIRPTKFTNNGLIEGTGTGTELVYINFSASGYTNLKGSTLIGGTFEAGFGNILSLAVDGNITTDDATLILNSAGSEIELRNTSTGLYSSLESVLTTIGNGGALDILSGRNYTTTNELVIDSGTLHLAGGPLTAASLSLTTSASRIRGTGTIQDAITNAGTIEVQGGTLDITGAITGAGHLVIDASSKFELGGATAEAVQFTGKASTHSILKLDAPASYTGTLGGLALGDVIDIASTTVSAATVSGKELMVTLTGGAVLDYALINTLASGLQFSISSDGMTGSKLTLAQVTAAIEAPSLTRAAMSFIPPAAASLTPPREIFAAWHEPGGAGIPAGEQPPVLALTLSSIPDVNRYAPPFDNQNHAAISFAALLH